MVRARSAASWSGSVLNRLAAGPLLRGGLASLGLLLVGAAAWMAVVQAPVVALQRCVSPDGPFAWLGVHLALLREHPDCADGLLALDVNSRPVVGLVIMVAVPTLLANVFMVLGLSGIWLTIRSLLARAAAAVRPWWHRPPCVWCVNGLQRRDLPSLRAFEKSMPEWQLDRSPVLRRGPPRLLAF